MPQIKLKIVQIEWVDSAHGSPGWQHETDVEFNSMNMQSVGFLFKETKKDIVLVPHLNFDAVNNTQIAGYMIIPKCCIVKRKTLK